MGITSGAATGAAAGGAYGAVAGAIIGGVTGAISYKDKLKQTAYERNYLTKKIGAIDDTFSASIALMQKKYNIKVSGVKAQKIDLTDTLITKMDALSVDATKSISLALAQSVGSGVTGNTSKRLQKAASQNAELVLTNTYTSAKLDAARLDTEVMTAKATTQAEKEFRNVQYQNERDLVKYERDNIQDPNFLASII